nr:hypothetical protein StreXyl84_36840 [Streptomyces sp. Xyl84]
MQFASVRGAGVGVGAGAVGPDGGPDMGLVVRGGMGRVSSLPSAAASAVASGAAAVGAPSVRFVPPAGPVPAPPVPVLAEPAFAVPVLALPVAAAAPVPVPVSLPAAATAPVPGPAAPAFVPPRSAPRGRCVRSVRRRGGCGCGGMRGPFAPGSRRSRAARHRLRTGSRQAVTGLVSGCTLSITLCRGRGGRALERAGRGTRGPVVGKDRASWM